jgi:glutamine synthetase adenylyltransferase
MGSFAVGEPKLGSDVDLLVVTKNRDMEKTTRQFHRMNEIFSAGGLPKLDFRLRGEGANAPLVQDICQYESYFKTRVSPWEKIAFAKCEHWGGDAALADEFIGMLTATLSVRPGPDDLDTLRATRAKLGKLAAKGRELLETKRSSGGRYDIEYLCAVGLAMCGHGGPLDLATTARLALLESNGVISRRQFDSMSEALETYALVDYLLDLWGFRPPAGREQERAQIDHLNRTFPLLQIPLGGGIEATMKKHKKAVRACYEAVLKTAD